MEMFDAFYRSYSKTPKEKLLDFMRSHPDYAKLKQETQRELAIIYCERLVYSIKASTNKCTEIEPEG